ncbi:hypothetical protein [uncultured Serinicoccus sp.]|uniref:hypothetical protein n=1 Tax=uncultured Serinicoccus sp. TaxID=735514 RepID=UPI00262CC696|nr:hypothetical protein [uncultured Serinicoccus sp.]
MTTGWVPVRVVRWPAQQEDRAWCAERSLPCLLLVAGGAPLPPPGPAEAVLPATAGEEAVAAAVDELAWRPTRRPRADQPRPAWVPAAGRGARPLRRHRSLVGTVAALL